VSQPVSRRGTHLPCDQNGNVMIAQRSCAALDLGTEEVAECNLPIPRQVFGYCLPEIAILLVWDMD
jgi:hypothetical protein